MISVVLSVTIGIYCGKNSNWSANCLTSSKKYKRRGGVCSECVCGCVYVVCGVCVCGVWHVSVVCVYVVCVSRHGRELGSH